jgi:F-type H+-transporting ATPase subunit epsilon
MNLKILLPFQVFADKSDVSRIVAETSEGAFGVLPHRRDYIAVLVAGILTYETQGGEIVYVAVDEGVMVKVGTEVVISVRRAIGGVDLSQLHEAVRREFLTIDEQERGVRSAIAKMEGGFIRQVAEFQHGR